jgi:TatD DNase family protein
MVLVDTHAHLTAKEFQNDRDEVLERASEAGVKWIIVPSTTVEDSHQAIALAERHPAIRVCVGIHPHEASGASREALQQIERLSHHPAVVAIGEIGLDFHYQFAPLSVQREAFRAQLEIAGRRNLPVVIHSREALQETILMVEDAVREEPAWRAHKAMPESRHPAPRGVFHCFPGETADAWRVIEQGFLISFPGIITFKNAETVREVASSISLEHILLETDSPYMTPVPHRGKRNEPAHVTLVAARLAALQGLSLEDVARSTLYGAYRLFGVGEPGPPRITYTLRNSLYVNLTRRCSADCVFCDRKGEAVIKGHNLRIEGEPSAQEVLDEIGDPRSYKEIVFCGYGEPTIRLEVLLETARELKARGGKIRLDTNGHGNLIHGRNIVPELAQVLDSVSISLNSADPAQYGALMRVDASRYFPAMVEFARECTQHLANVFMTIVDLPEVDVERARKLIEDDIGAVFRRRPYF